MKFYTSRFSFIERCIYRFFEDQTRDSLQIARYNFLTKKLPHIIFWQKLPDITFWRKNCQILFINKKLPYITFWQKIVRYYFSKIAYTWRLSLIAAYLSAVLVSILGRPRRKQKTNDQDGVPLQNCSGINL